MGTEETMPPPLQRLLKTARLKHVPSGQIILYEGDLAQEVSIIKSGVVKIYDIDEQGNEKILHIAKSPSLIPMVFFSGMDKPMRWFYTALTDCDIYVLPYEVMRNAIETECGLMHLFAKDFCDNVHELMERVSSLSKTNAKDKIVAALKFLADGHSRKRYSGWQRVNFAVSHQLLADLCGVTRESAAMAMKELQDQGYVRSPRLTILEINFDKLCVDYER